MEQTTEFDGKKRLYHSRVRQRQAEETRQRILAAARSLFESQGYAATTLEAIAEMAEVSPKTVAAVFGSKRTLLAEVINPEAFSTPVQQLIEELRATEDPSGRLSLVAQIFIGSIPAVLALLKGRGEEATIESRKRYSHGSL